MQPPLPIVEYLAEQQIGFVRFYDGGNAGSIRH